MWWVVGARGGGVAQRACVGKMAWHWMTTKDRGRVKGKQGVHQGCRRQATGAGCGTATAWHAHAQPALCVGQEPQAVLPSVASLLQLLGSGG